MSLHTNLGGCSLAIALSLAHGLGETDAVHEVANLDGHHSPSREASLAVGGSAQHWHDEDDGVGAPREHGCPACPLDSILALLWLSLLGLLEADEERVDDVGERQHGEEPEAPAGGGVDRGLTRVSVEDHEAGGDTESAAAGEGLLLGELHHQDDLDEEQGHGEEPVDIAVCVVERNAGRVVAELLWVAVVVVDAAILLDLAWGESGVEAVEDAEVVVHCDECHETSEAQSGLVALSEGAEAQEEEHSAGCHGGKTEREHVVDEIILAWSEGHHPM